MSEDLLVDGYDYNPHTFMVEVPYNDYYDMKDKCKENKQLKSQLQQKESIIKEVREYIKLVATDHDIMNNNEIIYTQMQYEEIENLLEILDKEKI